MITSLLKTFLLSLPMSMGGLCNSGNSYVHNAYDRRNVATSINDNDDDYEMNSAMVHNNTNYVFKHTQSPDLFNNLPSYVEDTWFSYLFTFDFYIYDDEGNTHDYHGLHIYRNGGNYSCYAFPNQIEYQGDDVERFFYYRADTQVLTIGNFEDSNFVFDSIFVRVANINDNPTLDDHDFYPGEYQLNNWSVFNYFFYNGLKSFTFVNDINYNAPYGSDRNSIYITDATFGSSNPSAYVLKDISDVPFISNGTLYNDMRFRYFNGYATSYKDSSGNVHTSNFGACGYFGFFEYVRANDNLFDIALYRLNNEHLTSSSMSWYLSDNTQWNNEAYRYIQFMNDVDNNDIVMITKVNKAGGTFDNSYTDVGLGNAFNLMSTAFIGFSSLFGIAIIPGLSIGLLLFLPLIMSIVVLVFKAVKK